MNTPTNANLNPNNDPVIYAVGDIADCDETGDEAVAELLSVTTGPILTLGDTVYPDGTVKQFRDCFDPAWGQLKSRIKPVPGNHDYAVGKAEGYYGYFGSAAGDPTKGYYSYDIGEWHMIALNANCWAIGGCEKDSPMIKWLEADLASHPSTCTLAYYHQPRWSSGAHSNNATYQTLWATLVNGGVDVVLNGHDHDYERFALMNASGAIDTENGTREFVVGTGGKSEYGFFIVQPASQARYNQGFGVLGMTLHSTGYDWQFQAVPGGVVKDSGQQACH